ncbi:hypothetical protein [Herbiconiux daphne]|uniref:Uncharacterized protein n=1 Tax=Herbiconiux daphne TaxID=2970914 RepID=A0ABT2H596_9MICO|nr:hypothetical protein [Herbiconiux daphne]MCS5735102.1 hypothetical protein [Herbiconiux daphne]
MPRLTSNDYLSTRSALFQLWTATDGFVFAVLSGHAQRDLHDYFAFTVPMTDREALAHRTAMTKAFPSLPQTAGRAFQAVNAHVNGQPNQMVDRHLEQSTVTVEHAGKTRKIRALGVAHPKVKLDLLARATVRFIQDDMNGKLPKSNPKTSPPNRSRK